MTAIVSAPKTALFYIGLGLVLSGARVLRRCMWAGAAIMHAGTWLVCWTREDDDHD